MASKKIVVLPGDGIGPEVVKPAVKVLEAVAASRQLSVAFEGGFSKSCSHAPITLEILKSVHYLFIF